MRRLVVFLALWVAVLLVPCTAARAGLGVGARYDSMGSGGILTLANASGYSFTAVDRAGRVVASGTVAGQNFSLSAANSGPDGAGVWLSVSVAGETFSLIDHIWEWD